MTPKAFCLTHGLNQSDFGRLVGLDKATISRLFNGVGISAKNAVKIEEKTDGGVTRADVRPDLFGPVKRRSRRSLRKAMPQSVSESETAGQDKRAA